MINKNMNIRGGGGGAYESFSRAVVHAGKWNHARAVY